MLGEVPVRVLGVVAVRAVRETEGGLIGGVAGGGGAEVSPDIALELEREVGKVPGGLVLVLDEGAELESEIVLERLEPRGRYLGGGAPDGSCSFIANAVDDVAAVASQVVGLGEEAVSVGAGGQCRSGAKVGRGAAVGDAATRVVVRGVGADDLEGVLGRAVVGLRVQAEVWEEREAGEERRGREREGEERRRKKGEKRRQAEKRSEEGETEKKEERREGDK